MFYDFTKQSVLREVKAEGKMMPTPKDNTSIGLKSTSELVPTNNGYMRVYYTGENIGIEYYDDAFNIIEKRTLAMELKAWGGFYAGSDGYYYVVEGQSNVEENDAAEVIRVIKYDAAWNKKGAAKITSNSVEIRFPFANGCVEMAEHNGTLYIVTGHEGYVDPMYYQGHQGFLMIAVDKATMTGKIVDSDLWHSLSQYIEADASDVYVLEKSEDQDIQSYQNMIQVL